jgi:hypothetical protein
MSSARTQKQQKKYIIMFDCVYMAQVDPGLFLGGGVGVFTITR